MAIPFFIPAVTYVEKLLLKRPVTLEQLCKNVGIACKATGPWTKRRVEIMHGEELLITAEPGDWGSVRVQIPESDLKQRERIALVLLAFGLHDLVAKQSIADIKWLQPGPPKGRPRSARALSSKERQRRFRARSKRRPAPKSKIVLPLIAP